MFSFVLPEFQGQRLGCGVGIFFNRTVRDCPVILNIDGTRAAAPGYASESDRILVGHHRIVAVSVVLLVAKIVNVCQLGEK